MGDAAEKEEEEFRFAKLDPSDDATNAADNERDALMAVCVALQQGAGFKTYIDLREPRCLDCGASGFNTGWGYFQYTCGLEVMSDGEPCAPCGNPGGEDRERG